MEVIIDLEKIALNQLTPNKYLILWSLANGKDYYWLSNNKEDNHYLDIILKNLEDELWIKILEDNIVLRGKALKLGLNDRDYSGEVKEVIEYLNLKVEKARGYKWDSMGNMKPTKARLAEGYSVEDLKSVIDEMYNRWAGSDMQIYLRPSTLFNVGKFQNYINMVQENISENNLNEERA